MADEHQNLPEMKTQLGNPIDLPMDSPDDKLGDNGKNVIGLNLEQPVVDTERLAKSNNDQNKLWKIK